MLRFITDEDFDRRLLVGAKRRLPSLDIVRVQDVGLSGRLDDVLLEWAASEGRLMLTHDAATMPDEAYRRVEAGLPMPGVVIVNKNLQLGLNIDDIIILATASFNGEWENRAIRLPL